MGPFPLGGSNSRSPKYFTDTSTSTKTDAHMTGLERIPVSREAFPSMAALQGLNSQEAWV